MVLSLASSNGRSDLSCTEGKLTLCALINRSLMYLQHDDYGNALDDLLLAVELSPHDKTICQTLGVCYHKLAPGFLCFIFFILSIFQIKISVHGHLL